MKINNCKTFKNNGISQFYRTGVLKTIVALVEIKFLISCFNHTPTQKIILFLIKITPLNFKKSSHLIPKNHKNLNRKKSVVFQPKITFISPKNHIVHRIVKIQLFQFKVKFQPQNFIFFNCNFSNYDH